MSARISEPLPSITEHGRAMAAVSREHDRLDELGLAGGDRGLAMHNLVRQEDALRDLIAALPAVTLSDAVVQIGVAYTIAEILSANDWNGDAQRERLGDLHKAVKRLTMRALPLLAQAARLSMADMGWADVERMRSMEFGTGGDA